MRYFALACLSLASFALPAAAQCRFDYITFDRMQIDPAASLGFSKRWGILVNTGAVPISLENDWEGGLWYGQSTQPIGVGGIGFFYDLLNPFQNDLILQPGEAIGDADPLLLAELLPGETFVGPALISTLQLGAEWPVVDFDLDLFAQIGTQVAKTRTTVELASLGGPALLPVSARRFTCEPSPVAEVDIGAPCGEGGLPSLAPLGVNSGSGPPYVAYWSNMPHLGNWAFGVEMKAAIPNQAYLVLVDIAPGSFPVAECTLHLALTPFFAFQTGVMVNFDDTMGFPLPNLPFLSGLVLYFQGFLTAPVIRGSNAVAVTLGVVTS